MQYRGNFTDCHVCGYDLRTFPSEPADTHVIHETNWYLSILQSGFVQLQKDKDFWIYSFSFFSLLRLMMKMTINEWSKKGNIRCESVDPDSFPIEVRYRAVQFLVGMFQDWPYRFVEYCRSWGIQYHKIKTIEKICRRVPFWIESDVQPRLYAPNVEPSEESVLAAIDLMKIQKRRVNISSVNKFMGYVDAITVRRIVKTRVYRED
ncbi:hypothetical protein [Vibrio mangrovi]|uniref:Uncharacterized protein n=1 Tax=Vibrio mangrovi TaxID=474394 RepID=A0ABU4I5P3_9VIBR|nr:hypothetical protein [Vibrio mangrovi]MDW6002333.1 hypothetical protein [Vibrio mangrovi]